MNLERVREEREKANTYFGCVGGWLSRGRMLELKNWVKKQEDIRVEWAPVTQYLHQICFIQRQMIAATAK